MSVNLLRSGNPNGRHNDMHYGEDDPTLWPQQYTSKFTTWRPSRKGVLGRKSPLCGGIPNKRTLSRGTS
ncbi:hypothetical protein K438DRAFT_1945826 [Mycena galopus ATCC 62051]|nr:hypothetical protein K438DRAFT_1945826 [Mycena galopus ATCC 62051]